MFYLRFSAFRFHDRLRRTGQAALEHPYLVEDLPQMAATQYRLADQFCATCGNFHALWPYRRIARLCGAAEAGGSDIEAKLGEVFRSGRRRVLIAGAADTGLLALTARAGVGCDIEAVVLDRCRTPLDMCQAFAQRWSIAVETRHQDLTDLDVVADFDVVFANSILQFISPDRRVDFLSRLRRAMRQDGRLVNVFNVSARVVGETLPEYRAGYSGWVLSELERRNIPLPESRQTFLRRLDDYAREFESREGSFNTAEQFLALHARAGFEVSSCVETGMSLAQPWQQFVAKLAKRRYILVAGPDRSGGIG
jgi:cyclopropane fatty-acyl-phospholipid synthase-like methyltransferase